MNEAPRPRLHGSPQVLIGLIIVAVGLVFLAGNYGLLDADTVLSYWPVPILVLGAVTIINADSNARRMFGAFIVLIGLWGSGHQFWGISFRIWNLWPAILIAIGIMLVMRSREQMDDDDGASPDQTLNEFAFWSGKERRVSSSFKRGDLTAVMGGIELDLRSASTTAGQAVIEVFAFWGGIEIRVPPDWIVENQVSAIMGGSEDKSGGSPDARNRLILRGIIVMGGLEIKT